MATYYVDGAVGNDGNAGTSEGAGNAWATIQKAMDTVSPGDTVYVKASATYTENVQLTTVGTSNSPIVFVGYATTANRTDRGKVTIDASGLTNCLSHSTVTSQFFYTFENFKFINAVAAGVNYISRSHVIFRNCEFNNNGGYGIFGANGFTFESCIFSGNGAEGFRVGTAAQAFGCYFAGNTSSGAYCTYGTISHSVFYNNGDDAITFLGSNGFSCIVLDCTIDGNAQNTLDGIRFPASYWGSYVAINNVIYDCTTGISGYAMGVGRFVGRNNLMNSNTTDYSDSTYETLVGEVTSAPAFTNEASQDYTLGSSSPALDAGFDAYEVMGATQRCDIGALESTEAAGGGGGGGGASWALKDGSQLT